jgi:hypothetical protein
MYKIQLQILLISLFAFVFHSNAQVYNLGEGADTIYTCNGTLYDPGGQGNYLPNQNITQTFCPDIPGDAIQFDFSFFGLSPGTIFQVFDGVNTSAPIIGTYSNTNFPRKITGSESGGGCLTIRFSIGNSTNSSNLGFVASLQCVEMPTMLDLGENNVDTLINCNSLFTRPQSFSTPPSGSTIQHTVCPTEGNCLKFELEVIIGVSATKYLKVYDGPSNAFPLLENYSTLLNEDVRVKVISSSLFGGCLTFETSSQVEMAPRFRGLLTCLDCDTTMLRIGSVDSIQVCDINFVDPGGDGNYSNNSNVTQTICAGEDNILRAHFDFIELEENWDTLLVFSGSNAEGYLLGVFTGFVPEEELPVFTSTPYGDGCLTFRLSTDDSQVYDGFKAWIECLPRPQLEIFPAPTECDKALGLCNDQIAEVTTYTSSYNHYDSFYCMNSTFNPTWFYLKSGAVGDIDVGITATSNVTYACWGPYSESQWLELGCNMFLINNDLFNVFNMVSCGNSGSYININIPDTSPGEYYVIMFVSQSSLGQQNVNLFINNGTAVSCSETCNITANLEFSTCDSLSNTYAVSGLVELNGNYQAETVTVISSNYGALTYPVGSSNTLEIEMNGLASSGEAETLLIQVSDFETCRQLIEYNAPTPCSPCPVFINNMFDFCPGEGLNTMATTLTSGVFVWEGPQGIIDQDSVLNIPDFNNSMEGIYQVWFTDTATGCSSLANGFMNLIDFPELDILIEQNQEFYCQFDDLFITASPGYSPYNYSWTGPNLFSTPDAALTSYNLTSLNSGEYTLTQNYRGCLRQVYSMDIDVLPLPPMPSINYLEELDMLETDATGGTFNWYFGNNVLIEDGTNSSQVNPTLNSSYYVVITDENGCSNRSTSFSYNLTGIDRLTYSESVSLYPNPFVDEVSIVFPDGVKCETLNFAFYDQTGRLVLKEQSVATNGKYTISAHDLSQGIYLIHIMEGENVVGSFKLIKS